MVIAKLDLHVCCNKKSIALALQSVDNNSNQARTHISQNTTSENKAKTISRRKGRLEHSINHNYSYGKKHWAGGKLKSKAIIMQNSKTTVKRIKTRKQQELRRSLFRCCRAPRFGGFCSNLRCLTLYNLGFIQRHQEPNLPCSVIIYEEYHI